MYVFVRLGLLMLLAAMLGYELRPEALLISSILSGGAIYLLVGHKTPRSTQAEDEVCFSYALKLIFLLVAGWAGFVAQFFVSTFLHVHTHSVLLTHFLSAHIFR